MSKITNKKAFIGFIYSKINDFVKYIEIRTERQSILDVILKPIYCRLLH